MNDCDSKILVIEDDRIFNKTLCEYLQEQDYHTESAYTCEQGFNFIKNKQYIAIVIDLHLPDNSGLEILKNIDRDKIDSTIIVISGIASESEMIACYDFGADFVLNKPFNLSQIDQLIKRSDDLDNKDARFSLKRNVEGWIELTADSYFGFLERIKNVTQVLKIAKLGEDIQYDITMALDEMGRNAIEWGNSNDRAKKISISYALFANEIVFKIEDEGGGFEVNDSKGEDVLSRLLDRKKEGKRPGGFGITMVKKVMDKVIYNDRGNVVLISKSFK